MNASSKFLLLFLVCSLAARDVESTTAEMTAQQTPTLDEEMITTGVATDDSLEGSNAENDEIALVSDTQDAEASQGEPLAFGSAPRIINKIHIIRNRPNKYITADSIRNQLPFKEGQSFNKFSTNNLLRRLYGSELFEQIIIRGRLIGSDKIDLYIIAEEQIELAEINVTGNKALSDKDIEDDLKTANIKGINERKVAMLKKKLLDLYRKKNYHFPTVESTFEVKDNKAYVTITITENEKSLVKRVFFRGNCNVSDKRLSQFLLTQEDWLFGLFFKAGNFQQESIERDKRAIEYYYKTQGYINARVTNATVDLNPADRHFYITFDIEEGEQFRVGEVHAQSHESLSEEELLRVIPLKPGSMYNIKQIADSIDILKNIYSQFGYAFVDVAPDMQPDEATKTVNINFNVDFGDRVYVNRINIIGNEKTRDKVIRRKLLLNEGDLLTNDRMEMSKDRVMGLSYFDTNNGVNWKVTRLNKELADLDLIVKETKTGRVSFQVGYGGSPDNPMSSTSTFSVVGSIMETNLLGLGTQISLNGQWAREEWSGSLTYVDPYFLDRPMVLESNAHVVQTNRDDQLRLTNDFKELNSGGQVSVGYIRRNWFDTVFKTTFGIENISIKPRPLVQAPPDVTLQARAVYQLLLDNRFQPGTMGILQEMIGGDVRNHTMHPTKGYQWFLTGRLGFPIQHGIIHGKQRGLSFFKFTGEASWYTPIIGEADMILGLHGYVGWVGPLGNNIVPFRELFHIGGTTTVRGFDWGQIGPIFRAGPTAPNQTSGDSLGAMKAFYVNAELIFPVRSDFSIKGCIFYDGGAGWDTPIKGIFDTNDFRRFIANNNFEFRHTIGFGFRMTAPQPFRFDWGFKLDRKKNESPGEIHLSGYREF